MKTIQLSLLLCLIAASALFAQQKEQVVLKRVSSSEVPAAVIASVERDFPGAAVDEINILPVSLYADEWKVADVQDNLNADDEILYYAIEFFGERVHGEAVYDGDGTMVNFKEVITDEALPNSIREIVAEMYPGWIFIKDREEIRNSPSGDTDKYRITIKKGKEKKVLFFDVSGNLLEI